MELKDEDFGTKNAKTARSCFKNVLDLNKCNKTVHKDAFLSENYQSADMSPSSKVYEQSLIKATKVNNLIVNDNPIVRVSNVRKLSSRNCA